MTFKYGLLLLSIVLAFSACRKDIDQFILQPGGQDPELVTGTALGKVRSLDGAPLEGALVRLHGGVSALSDGSGFYFIPDAEAPALDALLEVSMNGFFPAYQHLPWTEKGELRTDIRLVPKSFSGSLSGETGGQLAIGQGFLLDIPQQGLEYPTGDPFTGTVQVYAYWIDPGDPEFLQLAPAGARGLDANRELRYLNSYGILAMELTDENGLPLRTAPGKTMDLHFPVPGALTGTAPSELALWSFDPEAGLWNESATATLSNQYYHGKAPSGLFWNVAGSSLLVQVKGWVQQPGSGPAREVEVLAWETNGSLLARTSTQNQGQFVLVLPGDAPATLQLLDLCGNEQYTQDLPALSGNVSLNPIPLPSENLVPVKGRLVDCDEAPVSLGYMQAIIGDKEVLMPLVGGAFSALLPVCPEDVVTLIGFDLVRNFQTAPLSFSASGPIDAGDWILCNDAPEYISYNLDGEVQFSSDPGFEVNGSVSTILDSTLGVSLSFEGTGPGTFPVLQDGFSLGNLATVNTLGIDLLLNISRYDPPGGYVIGSFNGKVTEVGAQEHQVSGVFKLQRN